MVEPLWTPSPERAAATRLARFLHTAREASGRELRGYDDLWRWSVEEPAAFWGLWADEAGVIFHTRADAVLEGDRLPHARWFPGSTLNFAENLLRDTSDRAAVLALDERDLAPRTTTFRELRAQVASFQAWLRAQGVGPGDRVAGWLPNRPEALVAMLATTALGAVWSSSSPDFGVQGVVDRFSQITPKVLIVADGSVYGGKVHRTLDKAQQIAAKLGETLQAIVVIGVADALPDLSSWPAAIAWDDAQDTTITEPTFAPLPFDHPVFVLYSSGTTGVPKCIVHGAGGTLLQHSKEHQLHTDLGPDSVLFYFTTTGWMMWNWLVSALFSGTAIVMWDGSPVHPANDTLWRMAQDLRVTAFGTSPRFLALCEQNGLEPGRDYDLSALRVLLATGSPLPPEGFRWAYEHVKADMQLASICGGTDIISCFMLGSPIDPVYAGEIQRRGLGMAVEAWAAPNRPVIGERAELVCTVPFPSAPVGFWNDPDHKRYHAAYFQDFPGVWRHGDFIELTPRHGVVVHGRSDATLNPGGVRIGTSEIYGPVEAMAEVSDSVVIALPQGADVEVVLFVVPAAGVPADAALATAIRRRIREAASPRHVPGRILAAPAIPRTISGKKVEIAVLQALRGEAVPNRDALANPEAIDWFIHEAGRLREAPSL